MPRVLLIGLLLAACAPGASGLDGSAMALRGEASSGPLEGFSADRFVAMLAPGVSLERGWPTEPGLASLGAELGVLRYERLLPVEAGSADPEAFARIGLDRLVLVHLGAGALDVGRVVSEHDRASGLLWAEVDGRSEAAGIPNDSQFVRQWGFVNDGSFNGQAVADADIDADTAWDIETGDGSVVVAVLDSGSNFGEPDVNGRLWTNAGEVAGNGLDDDGNGYVDDVHGYDFINNDADPSDDHGHGVNVASIAVAEGDNGLGYAGMCWNCQLMTGKNLGSNGNGTWAAIAESLVYAVDAGADVINMSIQGGYSSLLETAAQYMGAAGTVGFACMGNWDSSSSSYPAAFPEMIAVGATDSDDSRASPFTWGGGSNYGAHNDLVAPGNVIYGHGTLPGLYSWYWSGTSQATPMAAGTAALMLTMDPSLSAEEIRSILQATAQDEVGPANEDVAGFDPYFGHGRLNAAAALAEVLAGQGDDDDSAVDDDDSAVDDDDSAVDDDDSGVDDDDSAVDDDDSAVDDDDITADDDDITADDDDVTADDDDVTADDDDSADDDDITADDDDSSGDDDDSSGDDDDATSDDDDDATSDDDDVTANDDDSSGDDDDTPDDDDATPDDDDATPDDDDSTSDDDDSTSDDDDASAGGAPAGSNALVGDGCQADGCSASASSPGSSLPALALLLLAIRRRR